MTVLLDDPVDLLGDPVIRRQAHFPAPDLRSRLGRTWGPGPRGLVIGCNPSSAGSDRDDPTSRWWNGWFEWAGFGGYDAVNLYPFISASPKDCRERTEAALAGPAWGDRDALFANADLVVRLAKRAEQVFVCWGAIAWDVDWIEHLVERVQTGVAPWPSLWCWGLTGSGAPKHPLARGAHRIAPQQQPILWRAKP